MLLQILLFVVGLTALYYGAEWMVRGAARLARSLGMSALVVGLTIVAFGTSAPELVVSGLASARHVGDLAMGNVVGSNVVNIGLILGLAALFYPIRVDHQLLRREIPLMIGVCAWLVVAALDGGIERLNGALFLAAFVGYIGWMLYMARHGSHSLEAEYDEFETAESMTPTDRGRSWDTVLIVVGITGLSIGAHMMVTSAVYFAERIGVSELVIGVTVVSIGTSLPELATVLVAAFRDEADIALGNAIGSNIFNVLAILGVAASIQPIDVAPSVLRFELPAMLGVSFLLLPFAWTRLRLERWEGALLVACYIAFTWAVLLEPTGSVPGIAS